MKKYTLLATLSAAFLFAVINVPPAEAIGDIDPNPPSITCVELTRDLRLGSRDADTNGEVTSLQEFLVSIGLLDAEPTGYFGNQTLAAVKAFQTQNGLDSYGFVGPLTRAAIKQISCGTGGNSGGSGSGSGGTGSGTSGGSASTNPWGDGEAPWEVGVTSGSVTNTMKVAEVASSGIGDVVISAGLPVTFTYTIEDVTKLKAYGHCAFSFQPISCTWKGEMIYSWTPNTGGCNGFVVGATPCTTQTTVISASDRIGLGGASSSTASSPTGTLTSNKAGHVCYIGLNQKTCDIKISWTSSGYTSTPGLRTCGLNTGKNNSYPQGCLPQGEGFFPGAQGSITLSLGSQGYTDKSQRVFAVWGKTANGSVFKAKEITAKVQCEPGLYWDGVNYTCIAAPGSAAPIIVSVSNSLSGPWVTNGSALNTGKIYTKTTGIIKARNPKGCAAPAGNLDCLRPIKHRIFTSSEWINDTTIITVTDGGVFPNGTYDTYIMYSGETPKKVGSLTLKAATTTTTSSIAVAVSNSLSGPWVTNGSVFNSGQIYVQTTGLVKSKGPKGCASPAGSTGCLSASAHRDFTAAEWINDTTVRTVTQGGVFPNGGYEMYIMYPNESPKKVGSMTLKAPQTTSPTTPACFVTGAGQTCSYQWSCSSFGGSVQAPATACTASNYETTVNVTNGSCYCGYSVTLSQSTESNGAVLGAATQCVDLPFNMHRGYESSSVTNLQTFLSSLGLMDESTGFYGDQTVAAVKAYQGSRGLAQTGMTYELTRSAIKGQTCPY